MVLGSSACCTKAARDEPKTSASDTMTDNRWKAVMVGESSGVADSVVNSGSIKDAGYESRCSKWAKKGG
jgi:hypothetical protein